MSEASQPSTTTGGAAFPDATLVAICDEIAELNQQAEALDDVDEANLARWRELTALAATMPATTLDGLRARLRAIGQHVVTTEFPGTSMRELRAQIVTATDELWRFAIGQVGMAEEFRGELPSNPDADLIATCAEFDRIERQGTNALTGAKTREEDESAQRLERVLALLKAKRGETA